MQENITLHLSADEIQVLKTNFSADDIYPILTAHTKEIESLIFSYHYPRKERIFDLTIDQASLKIEATKANFKVQYQIGIFNACADVDHTDYTKMNISMEYLQDQSFIVLTGEYWPERGQDEI